MNIEERKKLRIEYLKNAYDFFCNNKGREMLYKLNLEDKYENEIYLSFKYLADKKFIYMKPIQQEGWFEATITSNGIDEIEKILKSGNDK